MWQRWLGSGHKKSPRQADWEVNAVRKANIITRWDDIPLIFDIPIMVQLLGKSFDCVKKMCQRGQIPAFKIGTEWRFDKEVVRTWIERGGTTCASCAG